tara:strand:+ start:1363 stop:2370 length:1008 start_codon:yes stop_codon:yes gene_type:complete
MILITGSAGFIGFHLAKRLLKKDETVIGIDNLNDYYDVNLKQTRLNKLLKFEKYQHFKIDIENYTDLSEVFKHNKFDKVINLAAQAGVRHSIVRPELFIESNILGFHNMIELSKVHEVSHFIYASSSSVYGSNSKIPYSDNDNVSHPVSTYAMTKKANELQAHVYSHLFEIPTTGLRYFTVYGPYGRPDMAIFKFTQKIFNGEEIEIYNNGMHKRDFTYIDDIVEATINIINKPAEKDNNWSPLNPKLSSSGAPWKVYNVGNNKIVELNYFIELIENATGKKAKKKYLPMQPGDVENTYANIDNLVRDTNFRPKTSIEEGITKFVEWYKEYYKII